MTSNSAPGRSSPTLPSLRNSPARPSRPVSGLCAFTWKPMAMSIGVSAAKRSASTRSGSTLGVSTEGAVREHVEARHAQALGAGVGLVGARLAIRPGGTRTGIEQHRDDREIHAPARHLFLRQRFQPWRQRRPAVMPAGLEMPPARMEGDRRGIGKALARHFERRLHRGLEPVGVERPPRRAAVLDIFQHLPRPLADRDGRAQVRQVLGHSSRPRPLGLASSVAPGFFFAVK